MARCRDVVMVPLRIRECCGVTDSDGVKIRNGGIWCKKVENGAQWI